MVRDSKMNGWISEILECHVCGREIKENEFYYTDEGESLTIFCKGCN
jgi:hypothetical protein